MFDKILVANRGEIACRIIKTAQKMNIKTVAVFSEVDRSSLHVQMADEAVYIGPGPSAESYLKIENLIKAVKQTNADAVHPGYGFLSENPAFAEALESQKISFIGPSKEAIKKMGDKITSKKVAMEAGVNTIPGFIGTIKSPEEAIKISKDIGYPVMIKASAGGGGKGMRIARDDQEVVEGFNSSKNEASRSFGDDRLFIEKFIEKPRHIEIQILADKHGNCIHLGERECSIQRRNQKIIEEAPSPFLNEETRDAMGKQAIALARAVEYTSAGTVEFIVDCNKNFYFLEMNTRLQVEHPVTELITNIDLVEKMIGIANGSILEIGQNDVVLNGWAIENRVYAEDPVRDFLPSIGRLSRYRPPAEFKGKNCTIRNDSGVFEGSEISLYYDPMLAKVCSWAPTRSEAIDHIKGALGKFELEGVENNIEFLSAVMGHKKFSEGQITTAFIEEEFPEGFKGVELTEDSVRQIAACCVSMHRLAEIRRTKISGRLNNHERTVGNKWVVGIREASFNVLVDADQNGSTVTFGDGSNLRVSGEWLPGDTLAELKVDEEPICMKVSRISEGFRVRSRGADLKVFVRSPRQAELAKLMPTKLEPDSSKQLLCPMPGLIVKMNVQEGQQIQKGQALCVVEAMKMENTLRAERKGVIAKIKAFEGDSLAVDQVIIEFE